MPEKPPLTPYRAQDAAEILDILRQAAKGQAPVTIDTLLERAQRKKPALDETASAVLAAHDAEQEQVARRFQDLLSRPDDATPGSGKR